MTNPRVFVNYTRDSAKHTEAVWQFVVALRGKGIDARSDHDIEAPPEGWPRWMTNQVRDADFVLSVCTSNNAKRFEGQEKPGRGRGATFEGLLLNQIVYEQDTQNRKVIPVLLKGSSADVVPGVLRPYTHYKMPKDWEKLLRRLTAQPAIVAPPLGQVPVLPSRATNAGNSVNLAKKAAKKTAKKISTSGSGKNTAQSDEKSGQGDEVAEKLVEFLKEYDEAVAEGYGWDWKPIVRWYTSWRVWLDRAFRWQTSRIERLVAKGVSEVTWLEVGRRKTPTPFVPDYDDAVANLRSEVMALLKPHVPISVLRRLKN